MFRKSLLIVKRIHSVYVRFGQREKASSNSANSPCQRKHFLPIRVFRLILGEIQICLRISPGFFCFSRLFLYLLLPSPGQCLPV